MRVLRVLRWAAVVLAALVLTAGVLVYGTSEYLLRQTSPARAAAVTVPTDAASIAEGHRLAMVHGCLGCHGPAAEGNLLFDEPLIASIVAPNLTQSIRHRSPADIATAIRHGVHPDTGRTMLVMPSQAFAPLTDADLGRILAFVASQPVAQGFEGGVAIGPVGRLGLVAGQYKTSLQLVQQAAEPPLATDAESATGRYLARTSCAQCHAADLGGASHPEGVAPSLRIVGAYSPEAFSRLMRNGIGLGDRKLGVMTGWAKAYFSNFTDAEIQALYRYLHDMPAPAAH
jgi:mono/diheme cytochrome c family protein